jgi:hypothetical protein
VLKVTQTTGTSETDVMSQKIVSDQLSATYGDFFTIAGKAINTSGIEDTSPVSKCTPFLPISGADPIEVLGRNTTDTELP